MNKNIARKQTVNLKYTVQTGADMDGSEDGMRPQTFRTSLNRCRHNLTCSCVHGRL